MKKEAAYRYPVSNLKAPKNSHIRNSKQLSVLYEYIININQLYLGTRTWQGHFHNTTDGHGTPPPSRLRSQGQLD